MSPSAARKELRLAWRKRTEPMALQRSMMDPNKSARHHLTARFSWRSIINRTREKDINQNLEILLSKCNPGIFSTSFYLWYFDSRVFLVIGDVLSSKLNVFTDRFHFLNCIVSFALSSWVVFNHRCRLCHLDKFRCSHHCVSLNYLSANNCF